MRRMGIRAKGQNLAFDPERASPLTKLKNDLLNPARGVGVISLEKMQDAHDVLATAVRKIARSCVTNGTLLNAAGPQVFRKQN